MIGQRLAVLSVAGVMFACGGGGEGGNATGGAAGGSSTTPDVGSGGGGSSGGGGDGPAGGAPGGGGGEPAGGSPLADGSVTGGAVQPPDAGPIGGQTPDAGPGPDPDAAPPPGDATTTPTGDATHPSVDGATPPPADAGPPPPVQADAQLRINEFMASNQFTINDDQGRASDWIELFNPGAAAVDLAGYRITNGFDEAARHSVLPAGVRIEAGGYLVLWADGRSQVGPTHLRFNLERAGGSIGLNRPDGSFIDRVDYAAQTSDISAARTPDASTAWQTLWEVTPGGPNPDGRGRPSPDEPRARADAAPSFDQAVQRLFDGLPEFHLTVADEHIQALRDDPRTYVPAMFTYNGRTIGPVGVRIKGQNSFLPIDVKPSLKIHIGYDNGNARFHGLEYVTLNNMRSDNSMIKEVVGYYMARTVGLFASRAGHALLYLNDEFYGVYTNLENIDPLFLNQWFADTSGPLYEGYDVDFRPEMVNRACQDSEDPNRPGCFELESGRDDRTSLVGLANALTQPGPDALVQAEQFVSFDQFHLYWAVCANIGQFDSFPYSNPGDDYHLYVEPESGLITLIPWGMDETFLAGRDVTRATSVLATRCLEDAACREGWYQQVWLVNDTMNAIDLAAEVDARAAVIEPYVALDDHKPYTNEQVAAEQLRVRNFILNRAGDLARVVPRP